MFLRLKPNGKRRFNEYKLRYSVKSLDDKIVKSIDLVKHKHKWPP